MEAADSSFAPSKRAGVCHAVASVHFFTLPPPLASYFFSFFLTAIWNHKEIKGVK